MKLYDAFRTHILGFIVEVFDLSNVDPTSDTLESFGIEEDGLELLVDEINSFFERTGSPVITLIDEPMLYQNLEEFMANVYEIYLNSGDRN